MQKYSNLIYNTKYISYTLESLRSGVLNIIDSCNLCIKINESGFLLLEWNLGSNILVQSYIYPQEDQEKNK